MGVGLSIIVFVVDNNLMPVEFLCLVLGLAGLVVVLWWWVRRWVHRGRNLPTLPPAASTGMARLVAWLQTPAPFPRPAMATPEPRRGRNQPPPAPTEFTPAQRHPFITVLLISGGLLAIMAHLTAVTLIAHWQKWAWLLEGIGVLCFLWGMRLTLRPRRFSPFVHLLWRLSHFFHLADWQLLLLILAPLYACLSRLAGGDQLTAFHPVIAPVAWILALTGLVLGSYRWWQPGPLAKGSEQLAVSSEQLPVTSDQSPVTRSQFSSLQSLSLSISPPLSPLFRGELLALVGLFLLALLLRATFLSQYPNTLSGDEGSAGLMALGFREGRFNNLFSVGWFSFPSFYYWLQGWGIYLLGPTIAGLRFTSAVAGALTVVAVYGLSRVLFGRMVGSIAAAFLLVSHFHLQFSRIGLNNIWDGLFLVLALTTLWYGWKTGWRGAFIICGLTVGLSQYFYVSVRILPVLLLFWALFAFLKHRHTFRQRWPDLLLAGYIALIAFLPMLLYFVTHQQEFVAPLQRVTIFGPWLTTEQVMTGKSVLGVVLSQMVNTALGITHVPLRHWYNPGVPLLLPGAAALFLIGVLWSLIAFDLRYLLLWLPLLAHIILGGLSQDAPASQRFVFVTPIVAILVALPLARTVEWLRRAWPQRQKLVLGFATIALFWLMATDFHYYFFEVYQSGYTLGGINTEVATKIAFFLRDQPEQGQLVYFVGLPRMGYHSHATIPYLAPLMIGKDSFEPLTAPPQLSADANPLFILLPERLDELRYIKEGYPTGIYQEFYRQNGELLFAVYDVP